MPVFEGPRTCICLWIWSGACVLPPVNFNLYQPKRRKGSWLSVLMFYASSVRGCCWKQCLICGSLCSRFYQCPSCVCVGGCLRFMLSFTTGWTYKQETSSHIHRPGMRPRDLCTVGSPKPRICWRWQPCVTSLNIQHRQNLKTAFNIRNLAWDSLASTHR